MKSLCSIMNIEEYFTQVFPKFVIFILLGVPLLIRELL